jgi:hypothetical protein
MQTCEWVLRFARQWTRCATAWTLPLLLGVWSAAHPFPVADDRSGLPPGSELDEDAITNPREVFHSEALRGHRSYMSNLGNLAFNSPYVLGDVAQKAHISCGSCHVNGASNPRLFVPGLSTHPGNFDTTSSLFNPRTDDGVLDPLTIPSLRGARFLAPYGHDGRTSSLRDFVRNVVVNEFGGAEPSPQILDAMVVYIEDIDFLPNPNLDAAGRLQQDSGISQRRGEALFSKSFPHNPGMSCAGCHPPAAAFVDHLQHDIGSGGLYKTPTLLNADFNAPYFHDGRFSDYGQVIDHFDKTFDLGLTVQDKADLLSYLKAAGDGVRPEYHLTGTNVLSDINGFAGVLDIAISRRDAAVIALVVKSVGDLLQDLAEHYPDPIASEISGGVKERLLARATIASLVEITRRVGAAAAAGHFDEAATRYLDYRRMVVATAPLALQSAEPWSLFDPTLHAAHQALLHRETAASTASR